LRLFWAKKETKKERNFENRINKLSFVLFLDFNVFLKKIKTNKNIFLWNVSFLSEALKMVDFGHFWTDLADFGRFCKLQSVNMNNRKTSKISRRTTSDLFGKRWALHRAEIFGKNCAWKVKKAGRGTVFLTFRVLRLNIFMNTFFLILYFDFGLWSVTCIPWCNFCVFFIKIDFEFYFLILFKHALLENTTHFKIFSRLDRPDPANNSQNRPKTTRFSASLLIIK